jgi:hypothetical protein
LNKNKQNSAHERSLAGGADMQATLQRLLGPGQDIRGSLKKLDQERKALSSESIRLGRLIRLIPENNRNAVIYALCRNIASTIRVFSCSLSQLENKGLLKKK